MRSRESIHAGLTDIFRELFGDETLTLSDETTAADIAGWDSFNNLNIIGAAEQRFEIRIGVREMESLSCIGDLVTVIERKAV